MTPARLGKGSKPKASDDLQDQTPDEKVCVSFLYSARTHKMVVMKIALINPAYEETLPSLEAMVTRYFHPRELAKALAKRMDEATWIQGFREEGKFRIGSTELNLFRARPFKGGIKELMSEHVDTSSLARVIDRIKPDVVHIMGLLPMDILRVAETCSEYTSRLSASFHGGHPSEDPSYYRLQLSALKKLSVILFNAPERARIWGESGLIDSSLKIAICPETSSFFRLKDREQIRQRTGIVGDPVCVASARLHPLKDPLTVIKGFEQILKVKQGARLYWVFQTDELLSDVEAMLDASPQLRDSVQLRGSLQFEKMEDFFNSADFFIQASLEEYGGNSLVEAMACGAIPVVTNIPSFRYLTGNDRFGTLFETGDSEGLAKIVRELSKEKYQEYSKRIRDHFDEFLSFDTIARTLQENIHGCRATNSDLA